MAETAGAERIMVGGRIPEARYRAMKLAMAHANIRSNHQFVVEAIEMKIASILPKGPAKAKKL